MTPELVELLAPQVYVVRLPIHFENIFAVLMGRGGALRALRGGSCFLVLAACWLCDLSCLLCIICSVLFQRWENLVKRKFKSIIKHPWHDLLQKLARLLQRRISINLNQPRLHIIVNHEVIAQDFETEAPILFVDFLPRRDQRHLNDRHDLCSRKLVKVYTCLCLRLLE